MKENKLILIDVYYPESGYGEKLNYPPVGIAYLSEYLDQRNIDHNVIDMGLDTTPKQIYENVKKWQPKWIGLSIHSLQLNKTKEILRNIKVISPDTKIVVGGPHVTTNGIKVFSELPIDFGIIGEGEESFYELVTNKSVEKIKGLMYRDSQGNIKANARRITEDIDTIPFPKFKRFNLSAYAQKTIPLSSSRGCPFKCIFCQCSSLLSKNWRGVSAEYFVEAIKYWQKRGYNEIQVQDDNFAFDINRLKKMVELYQKENIKNIKLILVSGLRVSSASKDTLICLKKLGVDFLSFGIESFNDKVLRFIKKGTTEKQIEERVKMATEMGFKVRLFFIIGFPYQTRQEMKKTYKFILKYPLYLVRFFNLIPYEGTELMEWLDANGRLLYPISEYMNNYQKFQDIPVFEAKYTMSPEERAKELKVARDVARIVVERRKYLFDE